MYKATAVVTYTSAFETTVAVSLNDLRLGECVVKNDEVHAAYETAYDFALAKGAEHGTPIAVAVEMAVKAFQATGRAMMIEDYL